MVARVIHSVGTIYAKLTVLTQQYANLQVEKQNKHTKSSSMTPKTLQATTPPPYPVSASWHRKTSPKSLTKP